VFDERRDDWAREREQLQSLLTDAELTAARRTTINAHYTDPAYVDAMWAAMQRLGFEGGRVLEPGSGAGTFMGMAPVGAEMTGIELDPLTASISRGLYPAADVRTESFADTRFPRASFDAAIGNVPFADVALHDSTHNRGGHSMHNHFIIKSLALTRPGGLVAVLTSRFTLDAQNPAARREMSDMADLVGAVRLPTGAHRRAAGTEAVTDLLILRRREPGAEPADATWESVTPRLIDGEKIYVNSYFDNRPDHILGALEVGTGIHGSTTLQVRGDLATAAAQLDAALTDITTSGIERGLTMAAPSADVLAERETRVTADPALWDGTIVDQGGGEFATVADGALTQLKVPRTHARELSALLGLRDQARALVTWEARESEDTDEMVAQRQALLADYRAYVDSYGPINRFNERSTGRVGAETGEEILARVMPKAVSLMRDDPFAALTLALERFDEQTRTAVPATLLTERVVAPRYIAQGAENAQDALALSLDRTGSADLAVIADLLGVDEADAREQLGTLVYDDPATGGIVPAPEYLSGNVRTKLEEAVAAAETNLALEVNVTALREVMPEPIGMEEIEPRLGAVWIDAPTHQAFLRDILQDNSVTVENPLPGKWDVRGQRWGIRATNEWGTDRRPATDIAAALMEQRNLIVHDTIKGAEGRERQIPNAVETEAAQEKGQALQARFAEWVWEEPERAARLHDEYNRRFNSLVLRDYSAAGDHLTLPGLASSFTPRPHQRGAVARMIAEPAVGLFHQVGAGKTAEMVMGTMELKRMGMVNKPVVVLPNHMLEQFSREWLQMYPQAKILAASTADLTGDKRRRFVARAAANDWDAVLMTQSAFKTIPLSPQFEADYIQAQTDQLRAALADAQGEDAKSIKQIEKAILRAEQAYRAKADIPRDPGLEFESTGIDYVVVDEMHMYKNLTVVSNIQDAGKVGSKQATDLHMKLEYLRSQHGDRVVTAATATPLANSVTEAYVMQRYLRPDLLEEAGITSFDGWAATFGEQVTELEMGPAGDFRVKTRFAKFQNVPEMLRMWHVFADVKTAEDLNLPTPAIAARDSDGERAHATVVIPPSPAMQEYIVEIADRAERVRAKQVSPTEDNMLKISGDGRAAALDMRLVRPGVEPDGLGKLDYVADRVAEHWRRERDLIFTDSTTREPSPITGGLQLVFCDQSTPAAGRWNAYDELRTKLTERGLPADSIRFIHEAKNDAEKGRLFAAARSGHVAVLIGSTGKMGVGTNVQDRITAMHHVDCPWRPSDLEQRDGRGIRQGNQNDEVAIYRYVVERSFDAYSYQTVERKAKFINQIMRGRLDSREIEDIGESAMSASEAKALASGNPLILEKAQADQALQKLRRQETAHHRAQSSLSTRRSSAVKEIDSGQQIVAQLREAAARSTDVSGDKFRIELGERTYTSRSEAVEALGAWAHRYGLQYGTAIPVPERIGSIGGHVITAHTERQYYATTGGKNMLRLTLEDAPGIGVTVDPAEALRNNIGTMVQLGNRVDSIPTVIAEHERRIANAHAVIAQADSRLGAPFAHADELAAAHQRVQSIAEQLNAQATPEQPAPSESTSAEPKSPFAAAFPRTLARDLSRGGSAASDRRSTSAPVIEREDLER
jgi:N12 class adenine-specific DNA methylase